MKGAQGGLLMIVAGIALFMLWNRGYLNKWIDQVVAGLSGGVQTTTGNAAHNILNFPTPVSGNAPTQGLGKAKIPV